MMNRRDFVQTAAAAGIATGLAGCAAAVSGHSRLQWKHFPAGDKGFFRAPVLLGRQGGHAHRRRLFPARWPCRGRSHQGIGQAADHHLRQPERPGLHYFSLGPIKAAFPAARVLAASDTIAAIRANVQKKIATWAPQLKENGPQKLADIVFPEAYDGPALMLEGNTIEIVKAQGLENRRHLWVPS